MIAGSLFALLVAAAPLDLALLPIQNSPEATKLLAGMLKEVEGVQVIALTEPEKVLGAEAAKKITACTEDQCIAAAIRPVHADGIIAGSVDHEDGRTLLRLRLIATSTRAQLASARTTHDLESGGLASALGAAVAELLPKVSAKSFGLLELANTPPNAELALDGVIYGVLAGEVTTLRVRAGSHRLAVRAPGHDPYAAQVDVHLGRKTRVELQLEKRRSRSPYVVAGIGAVLAAGGGVLGVLAATTASEWKDACTNGHCASGFTKERYDNDRSNVDRFRVSANILFVVSAAAVVAGGVWYLLDPGVEDAP